MMRASVAALALCCLPVAASAQTTSGGAPPPASAGPMIVEQIHSGFLVTPDVKITEVDKKTSELLGGYAGWVADDTIFIGGGGYWLANQSRDREMAYGGLVVQWFALSSSHFGLSAKGLVGGGRATLSSPLSQILVRPPRGRVNQDDLRRVPIATTLVRFREDFFVAEPELDALVRLTRHLRLTVGAGYRFTSAGDRQDDNRLRGAVGSVGLQIGGGH
jgi:hypothetical protein